MCSVYPRATKGRLSPVARATDEASSEDFVCSRSPQQDWGGCSGLISAAQRSKMPVCHRRGASINPGAALDRVISQADQDDCVLYKLADYRKGGRLLEEYARGGGREVEKLVLEEFGVFMYNGGRGMEVTRTEFLKWKFRNVPKDQLLVQMEPKSPFDPLRKWSDHEACWRMQYRGSLGETLLHVLIMCDTRAHTRVAKILLKCFPKLALDVVEGEEYLGASALHLAIAYHNNDVVTLLVRCGANIHQRAVELS